MSLCNFNYVFHFYTFLILPPSLLNETELHDELNERDCVCLCQCVYLFMLHCGDQMWKKTKQKNWHFWPMAGPHKEKNNLK